MVLEKGGGVDGHKARVGSRVMGGRCFLKGKYLCPGKEEFRWKGRKTNIKP